MTGKKKVGKSKAITWKKGHSSDSNPKLNQHRQAAKNRFFNTQSGASNLTVDALAKHDGSELDAPMDSLSVADDTQSNAGKTFNTWASNWTECTNATFSKVHRYWQSNSALHKEVLAVLAAVTEVIKTQGGDETETEYFAALMTTLGTVEGEQSTAAVAYLISLGIKRVSPNVLKAKFSEISKLLLDTVADNANTDMPTLLRSLMSCLASLLRVQEAAAWSNSSTVQVYNALLAFITHSKAKVRKAAHEAIRVVLKTSAFLLTEGAPPHHPAASVTAKHCCKQIEEAGGGEGATRTLHTLELLRHVMPVFPLSSLKSTCETILRVMTLGNVLVTSVSMRCLHALFIAQPVASILSAELNAQLITALYDYQPSMHDAQPLSAWLAVMESAHTNLYRLDDGLCISHLPRIVGTCMTCLKSEKPEASAAASATLKVLMEQCLLPSGERLGVMVSSAPAGASTPVHRIFSSLEAGLSYQYHASWSRVLQVLGACFSALGKPCHSIMRKCLSSMADLRDSHQFPHKVDLDNAVGMAIRAMGPQRVLEAIPLQITGENDDLNFPRSWLLPVLREHVRDTELAYFTSYFLPLSAKLRSIALEHQREKHTVEAQTYDTLQYQIWLLLPAFCTRPTDLKEAFKGLARVLGSALTDRPDLRMEVMSSLRKLITQNLSHQENATELGRFGKNYLPILFNLHTTDEENDGAHQAIFETVKCYLQVIDKTLLCSFFEKSIDKLADKDLSAFKRNSLLDLVTAMIPYIDQPQLLKLTQFAGENIESTDHSVQKKVYRLLEELCSCKTEASASLLEQVLPSLQQVLLSSLSSSSASSKAPRLRCLNHIFLRLEEAHSGFTNAVIPEAIACTKEVAEKARQAAYTLLVTIGNALIKWDSDGNKNDVVKKYFEFVLAGLAGGAHMVACTVLAITKLLFVYKDSISEELLTILVDNTCLLIQSKAREVVVSALGLLKVLLALRPDTELARYLQQILSSLVSMKEDNRHHFRFKSKEIFTRLIRKFGFDTVAKMVPDTLRKQLGNIKKTLERRKRQKKEGRGEDSDEEDEYERPGKNRPESFEELLPDTDSEMEDDDDDKSKKGQKGKQQSKQARAKNGSAAWLKEGATQEDIIDFLDSRVSQKILSSKPSEEKSSKKKSDNHGFKTAPDGRVIISLAEEEDGKKKKSKQEAPIIDDIDELLEAIGGPGNKASRKRKPDVADMDDVDDEAPRKYKAGGSGIHRPVAQSKKDAAATKQDYGAEYRSKKAAGDVKKKGRPDPFAYVPLEMKNLNKRKRAKAAGQFKGLVRGAKKGAAKGTKKKHKK